MLKINCNCDDSERTIKNIHVFANGEKYSGQKVVLSQNRWHHILNEITLKLDPYFGKVEKLYTTSSGLTISSFTDLENNAIYVASNRARKYSNVKGGYTINNEPTQEYFEHYLSSQLQRINKNKKLVYVRRDLLVIYIFRNGECGQSFKIVLTSEDLSSWSHILSYVALILDVPERCIKSLYSVNGNRICGPWELQHGASYVAVGYNQSFKKGCYHVDQKSTEVLTTGFPVVAKDKNLACAHKVKRKMKQNFRWNHYDQYTCVSAPAKKGSRKSKSSSKKSKRNSSQTDPPDAPTETKKNKKVTVHMRIKNSAASNVTITRNSGDSSPTHKNKKKWDDDDEESSELNASDSDDNKIRTLCKCTSKTCAIITKKNTQRNKYHSEPASPGSSEIEIPASSNKKKKKTDRDLTWKHMKKSESQNSIERAEKVTVKIKGGKAVILSGSSDGSKDTFDLKKDRIKSGSEKMKHPMKMDKDKEVELRVKSKSIDLKSKDTKSKDTKSKDCASNCQGKDECRFYKIRKPTMDKYKPLYCPNTSSIPKPKPKYLNTVLKQNRDNSDSRIKNRNCVIPCKEADKCKSILKRNTFLKKMSALLLDSASSIDSLKGRGKKQYEAPSTDSEDSSKTDLYEKKGSHNNSSCTICRIQEEKRNLRKRFK